MKKFLPLIAFWVVTMVAVVTGTYLYKRNQSADYDTTAVPYIMKVVPEISMWDPEKTRRIMAPEVAADIPVDKFERAMTFFSKLGALKSMDEPVFEKAYVDQETPEVGKQTIVEYNVETAYENGDATVNLQLLRRNNTFEIYRFNFGSQLLMSQE